MKKINCPICWKELVNLNITSEKISEFWCDDCNIDITVEENGKEEES